MKSLEYYYAQRRKSQQFERCASRIEHPWPDTGRRKTNASFPHYKNKSRPKHMRGSVVGGGRVSPR